MYACARGTIECRIRRAAWSLEYIGNRPSAVARVDVFAEAAGRILGCGAGARAATPQCAYTAVTMPVLVYTVDVAQAVFFVIQCIVQNLQLQALTRRWRGPHLRDPPRLETRVGPARASPGALIRTYYSMRARAPCTREGSSRAGNRSTSGTIQAAIVVVARQYSHRC